METKVILCDECKQRVARLKCDLCGKDICDNHLCNHPREMDMSFPLVKSEGGKSIFEFIFCATCDIKLYDKIKKGKLEIGKSKEFFTDIFKKNIMIDTLMKGGKTK